MKGRGIEKKRGNVKQRASFFFAVTAAQPARPKEILRVLRDVLGPLIRADGGEIYLVHVSDSAVVLHLGGRYSGCPGNTLARRRIIEPALQAVAPGVQVTVTAGALVPTGAELIAASTPGPL